MLQLKKNLNKTKKNLESLSSSHDCNEPPLEKDKGIAIVVNV